MTDPDADGLLEACVEGVQERLQAIERLLVELNDPAGIRWLETEQRQAQQRLAWLAWLRAQPRN